MSLTDALELLLLLCNADRATFERAALRWHGRFCREVRDVTLPQAVAVLALLAGVIDGTPAVAARALAELLYRRELEQPARLLIRWADRRAANRCA